MVPLHFSVFLVAGKAGGKAGPYSSSDSTCCGDSLCPRVGIASPLPGRLAGGWGLCPRVGIASPLPGRLAGGWGW